MKKVIIIGAGIAGLTAGVYARQNGFDVTIYESHAIPGGASTSWKRKGYLFEGGMHWLTGSSPKTALHKLWREIGALDDGTVIYNRDPFLAFEHGGKTAFLYRDIDKLQAHLTILSPEDEKEITRLCRDLKKCFPYFSECLFTRIKRRKTMPCVIKALCCRACSELLSGMITMPRAWRSRWRRWRRATEAIPQAVRLAWRAGSQNVLRLWAAS